MQWPASKGLWGHGLRCCDRVILRIATHRRQCISLPSPVCIFSLSTHNIASFPQSFWIHTIRTQVEEIPTERKPEWPWWKLIAISIVEGCWSQVSGLRSGPTLRSHFVLCSVSSLCRLADDSFVWVQSWARDRIAMPDCFAARFSYQIPSFTQPRVKSVPSQNSVLVRRSDNTTQVHVGCCALLASDMIWGHSVRGPEPNLPLKSGRDWPNSSVSFLPSLPQSLLFLLWFLLLDADLLVLIVFWWINLGLQGYDDLESGASGDRSCWHGHSCSWPLPPNSASFGPFRSVLVLPVQYVVGQYYVTLLFSISGVICRIIGCFCIARCTVDTFWINDILRLITSDTFLRKIERNWSTSLEAVNSFYRRKFLWLLLPIFANEIVALDMTDSAFSLIW